MKSGSGFTLDKTEEILNDLSVRFNIDYMIIKKTDT